VRSARSARRFILLGSAQPALVRQVSESLAGRVGIVELDPLTVAEVVPGLPKRRWTDVWLRGGFPDALRGDFRRWWESYLRTYTERDLPQLGVRADPLFLRRLLTIKAGRGDTAHAARVAARAMADVGADRGWILDQADGVDSLRPNLSRRGFTADAEWLP